MKKSASIALYKDSPLGDLTLVASDDYLRGVFFGSLYTEDEYEETDLLAKVKEELAEYFAKKRTHFTIPLQFSGTPFQERIFQSLYLIPYGKTRSYLDIAKDIGNVNATRAIGQALKKNPLPIFLPCHRVLSHSSKVTGYSGGIDKKIKLLELEGCAFTR